jgi:hypothetical protein
MANSYDRRINLYINGREIQNNLASIQKEIFKTTNELRRMTIGSEEYNIKAAEVKKLKTIFAEHQQQLRGTVSAWGKLKETIKGLLPVMSAAAAIGMLKNFAQSVLRVRAEFEKFEAVLTNSLGSNKKARQELQMLQEFASKTPFSLQELTGAFVKLTNYGLKPSREELEKYGDLASSVGKGFDQFVEAVADAVTGEFERLKEFGIKAKKEGDKITFTFKEQATIIDNNATAIKNYLTGLGDLQGVAGSMAAISETMGGKLSNLGDAWDNMLNKMGERTGGVVNGIVNMFTNGINLISRQLEILNADELGFWEKWWGSTFGTTKTYEKLVGMRNDANFNSAGADSPTVLGDVTVTAKKPLTKEQKAQQAEKARKEIEMLKDSLERAFHEEQIILKEQFLQKKITKQQFDQEMYALEMANLVAMRELYKQHNGDFLSIEGQIIDKKLAWSQQFDAMMEISQTVTEALLDEERKMFADIEAEMENHLLNYMAALDKETEATIDAEQKKTEAREKAKEAEIMNSVAAGAAAIENAQTVEEAGKAVLNSIRDQIKAYLAEAIAIQVVKALKSVPFPFNIIAATVAGGAASLLFNKLIPKFATGGFTRGAELYVAGEAGTEWIAPNRMLKDPVTGPIIASLENMRNSQLSPAAIRTFAKGGYSSESTSISRNNLNNFDLANNNSLAPILAATAKALDENAKATRDLMTWKPKVYTEMIKKDLDSLRDIEKKRGL